MKKELDVISEQNILDNQFNAVYYATGENLRLNPIAIRPRINYYLNTNFQVYF